MFVNFLQCFVLFLPIGIAKNFSNTVSSKSLSTEDLHLQGPETNKTIITEGGPITLLNASITAPKKNRTDLLSLDKSLLEVEEHTASPSHSKIKPRKGAGNLTETEESSGTSEYRSTLRQDTTTNHSHTLPLVNAIQNKIQNISKNSTPKDIKVPHTLKNQTIPAEVTQPNKTEMVPPKKPLILSYEKLASMDEQSTAPINDTKVSDTHSTAKAVNKDLPQHSTPMAMKSSMLSAGHPEMVIPVVITIIVVPMFALLGYMAIKRGKEAWQNRHYKRMDFLLDGMYND